MASLGRDMYMQTNNREDSASPILSAGMEGLFSLMNTIHTHPPSSRLLHEYSSASKSLSHSSNLLQALTNGGNDVASESEGLSLPNSHATTSALTRTSPFDDQATSLHRSIKQEATASVDSESGASVLGRQKRMRSSMECKGPEKEVLDTRKRSKHNENGYNLHAKTEPENTEKIKCTPPRAEKSRDMKTRKQSGSPAEQNSQGVRSNVSKSSSPVSEQGSPPKPEYIHVRARRGQATDSHSLAERVRREKISERMKYLQDLVPSCIKVTGKAMMLDEIINYVQSLQRQVEFLSMKLAAIPPNRLEYSFDALFGRKEAIRLNGNNTNSIVHNTPVQATLAQYSRNDHSSFLNTGNRNLIFPANTRPQQDVARYGMQLQINPNDQLAMSYTSADPPFFRDISSDMGVEESLLYHSAAGSNNCSLAASPAHAILEPAQHSYVQQNANLEMEWDDDLQNIVQQMGCAPQAGSPWLPGDHLFTEEGFSLPANIKNEL